MRPFIYISTLAILMLFSCKKPNQINEDIRNYLLTDSTYAYSWKSMFNSTTTTISRKTFVKVITDSTVLWEGNTYSIIFSGHYRNFDPTSSVQTDLEITDTTISSSSIGPASPGSATYGISLKGVRQ